MSCTLPVSRIEKPWGRKHLPRPFGYAPGTRIGEILFEPPAALDRLLVKYIFTQKALSVQVHPSDAATEAMGLGRQGKEECWLILDAEPGARLGVGLRAATDADALRQAALDGSIEDMLDWHPVATGDFFYIPAGTIHTIGAGISLIEIQQNSDITYRLYDYGRPRDLHLEEALAVARRTPCPAALRKKAPPGCSLPLVDGPCFRLDQLCGPPDAAVSARYGTAPLLVIPRDGPVMLDGTSVTPGTCALANRITAMEIPAGTTCLIAQPV